MKLFKPQAKIRLREPVW